MPQPQSPAGVPSTLPLTNVTLAAAAIEDTISRGQGLPGLVCLYGRSGYGKSTAAAYLATRYRAWYVEMKSLWTTKHLLRQILREMGHPQAGDRSTVAEMLDQVCETMAVSRVPDGNGPRPLIIDQADYLIDHGKAAVLMDLYEGSRAPVLFIGEEKLASAMKARHNTVHRRVLHWIEAQPASIDDCRLLAGLYCPGIQVADDLLLEVAARVEGCTGRVALNLHRIGEECRVRGKKTIDLAGWGTSGFLTGEPRRGV